MLAIDRAAVRARALAAFDAIGPDTGLAPESRALITDYLLGQLPERVAEQTRDRLAESPYERAWARVVASELAPLAAEPLPEIPDGREHGPRRLRGRRGDRRPRRNAPAPEAALAQRPERTRLPRPTDRPSSRRAARSSWWSGRSWSSRSWSS